MVDEKNYIFPEDVCDGETIHCPGGEDEDPGVGCPAVRCKADPRVVTVPTLANTSSADACRACLDLDGMARWRCNDGTCIQKIMIPLPLAT